MQSNRRWMGMHKDIKRFISLCPTCQKNRHNVNRNIAFPFTVSSYAPFEKLQIDFIVKLDPDEDGVDHIMVIIDTFSRWVSLYPMKGISAKQAADVLIQHCGKFGFPKRLSHDNDPVFMGHIMQEIISLIGSRSEPTMSYSKEESAIVERANKEVLRHLRNFIFDNAAKRNYSRYVPLVERIMNSSLHKATGFSPAQILFGNSVDLNRNTIIEQSYLTKEDVSYSTWVQELRNMQLRIIDIARNTLTERDEVHMINYPSTQDSFEVGSYVLVEYKNVFRRGPNSKLLPFLKGPLQVVDKDKSKYFLKDLITQRIKPYHVKRLSKFQHDPSKWDPLKVALRDTGDLFQVLRVSGYEGNPKGPKSQLFFRVHWVGYEETSMEPWANVKNNVALHEFLKNHKNKSVQALMPKNILTAETHEDSESEDDFSN
jgi:hypothetical protein